MKVGLSDEFLHVLTRLGHLQNLLLLLIYILVEVVGDLGVQHLLLIGHAHHVAKLALHSLDLLHLRKLLLFEFLVFKQLLALFQNVLSHRHRLFKVLVAVLEDLLKSLLVHSDHFLLVFKHFARLI